MITNAQNVEILSGARKAAILLVLIGDAASAELIKQLSDDEVQLVSREIARIRTITSEQAEAILEEFYQMVVAKDFVVKGGLDYAKKLLINAFGPEIAKKMMDRLVKALGNDVANLDILQKADPQQLAKFVHSEQDRRGEAHMSMVCQGCIISGGHVHGSILSPNVRVNSYAQVESCILFDGVAVGRHSRIKRAIVDKDVKIPQNSTIGYDLEHDRRRGFTVTDQGVVVVAKSELPETFR